MTFDKKRSNISAVIPSKSLEIGAGALIRQNVYVDPQDIAYWQYKPLGMIYINYCDQRTCQNILKRGKREEHQDGFIENLKIV